jgi:hypothetical protein
MARPALDRDRWVARFPGRLALGVVRLVTQPNVTQPTLAIPTLGAVPAAPVAGIVEPPTRVATVLVDVLPRVAAGGLAIGSEAVQAGDRVQILDGPIEQDGVGWYRVYIPPNQTHVPNDIFAWLPATADGVEALRIDAVAGCPPSLDLVSLAALTPPDQARCAAETVVQLRGTTWNASFYVPYVVRPGWLGYHDIDAVQPVSIAGDPVGRFRQGPLLDVQVAPGVVRPPLEFEIDARVVYGHEASAECSRVVEFVEQGLPPEAPDDSRRWCRWRPVLLEWAPRLGPELRPIGQGAVQLHRTPGGPFACAGVGMGPVVFHVDPTELDPVWLEVVGRPRARVVPVFSPAFRPALVGAELVVIGPTGQVVARDGLPFDIDRPPPGIDACGHGSDVWISVAP